MTTAYDAINRLITLKELDTASLASYAYDDLGRRTTVTLGNGTTTTYGYSTQGDLGSLAHNLAGTAQDQTYGYTRNQAREIATHSWSNDLYQWAGVAGNATNGTRSYTANGLNQYTAAAGAAMAHDTNGNLTGDGTWTYGYDQNNRLRTASKSGTSATLAYDAEGRLRQSVVTAGTAATLHKAYDGVDLVAEYAAAGTLQSRWVHGPGVDEPLVDYEGATTASKSWLYADHLGSIVATADATGTNTAVYSYGPYGEPNTTTGQRFRYTGQQLIGGLDLYYYKARFYDPKLGRFLQTDPIGTQDDMNLYAYVGGNPINYSDPTGEFANVIIGGGVSVALGYGISLMTNQNYSALDAFHDGAFGAVGAGIFGKINSMCKINEINQLTNSGRASVQAGAKKYTDTLSQSVTKTESNRLGNQFASQGEQFLYREPAMKVRQQAIQANFESTVLKSSENPKVITNIHANVTPLGTSLLEGVLGGVVAGVAGSASGN